MAAMHLHVLILLVTLGCLTSDYATGYYIGSANDGIISMDRNKRYTDSQDRASAYCTGMCMYDQKKPYSDCYDLCNWNGRGPSPWAKIEAAEKSSGAAAGGNSVNNLQAMMRTGAGGGRMRATKPRRKNKDKAAWES